MRQKKLIKEKEKICCRNIEDAFSREHPKCIKAHWGSMPKDIKDAETLLHISAQEPALAQILINALNEPDTDPNVLNSRGWTPL